MDANKLSVVMAGFVVKYWIVLKLGEEMDVYCKKKKKLHKKEREIKREKCQLLCHKLNITNNIIDEIILLIISSVVLSIKIQCYRIIYLFKFQYNTLSFS